MVAGAARARLPSSATASPTAMPQDHDHPHGHPHGHPQGHPHGHGDHDHGSHGHSHSHVPTVTADSERRVRLAMVLTGGFMLVEVVGGVMSGSLALLADAGHMLTDFAALTLSWFAFRLGRRPADAQRSYGWRRFEVLAAYTNGIALFAIAGWIVVEAARRFHEPVEVMATEMLVVAVLGLLVNVASFWVLSRGGDGHAHANLNVRSAALHVMGDLLGSVAAIAAAGIIMATGWMPIDPILSVLVAVLILRSAWRIVAESGHILLEGTPQGIDPAQVGGAVRGVDGVTDVHHVHAWSLTSERPLVTLHAVLAESADHTTTLCDIQAVLLARFGIEHATVQIERESCREAPARKCG